MRIGVLSDTHIPSRARAILRPVLDAFEGVDSHLPCCVRQGSILLFNPGSPTNTRGQPQPSFGLLTVDDQLTGEIRYF